MTSLDQESTKATSDSPNSARSKEPRASPRRKSVSLVDLEFSHMAATNDFRRRPSNLHREVEHLHKRKSDPGPERMSNMFRRQSSHRIQSVISLGDVDVLLDKDGKRSSFSSEQFPLSWPLPQRRRSSLSNASTRRLSADEVAQTSPLTRILAVPDVRRLDEQHCRADYPKRQPHDKTTFAPTSYYTVQRPFATRLLPAIIDDDDGGDKDEHKEISVFDFDSDSGDASDHSKDDDRPSDSPTVSQVRWGIAM